MLAYAFEAKSIQSYVLEGGKLRDMAGASALLDGFCNYPSDRGGGDDLLGLVLGRAGLEKPDIARRAGGAFTLLVADEERDRLGQFRALWTLLVQLRAPGLSFVETIAHGDSQAEATRRASRSLQQARNRPYPDLPVTPPIARRSPRSGHPAVAVWAPAGELIDAATSIKRSSHEPQANDDSLTRKFSAPAGVSWPIRMDEEERAHRESDQVFPLLDDNRYVGIVHADGNRLGKVLIDVQARLKDTPDYADNLLAFSQAVAEATERAAASATGVLRDGFRTTLGEGESVTVMPMRPILLGGDDLTVIVRGDLAIPFTRAFLVAFTHETRRKFESLKTHFPLMREALPEALSAGAGIAFVKASQPFHLAYGLAESLATLAKTAAKQAVSATQVPPSCLAFHRITTAMIDSYEAIAARERVSDRRSVDGKHFYRIESSLNPYRVETAGDEGGSLPSLDALLRLGVFLCEPEISRGPLRRLTGLAQAEPREALGIYERWRTVMEKAYPDHLRGFDERLGALGCRPEAGGVCEVRENGTWRRRDEAVEGWDGRQDVRVRSPLLDALALIAVAKGGAALDGSPRSQAESAA